MGKHLYGIAIALLATGCATFPPTQPPKMNFLTPRPIAPAILPECKLQSIDQDSPAAAAGLKPGDVLVAFNGMTIRSAQELKLTDAPKDSTIVFLRGKKRHTTQVTLRTEPPKLGVKFSHFPQETFQLQDGVSSGIGEAKDGILIELDAFTTDDALVLEPRITNNTTREFSIRTSDFNVLAGPARSIVRQISPQSMVDAIVGQANSRAAVAQGDARAAQILAANAQNNASYTTNASVVSMGNYAYGSATTSQDPGSSFASSLYTGYAAGAAQRTVRDLAMSQQIAASIQQRALPEGMIPPEASTEGLLYFQFPNAYPIAVLANINGQRFQFQFDQLTKN